MKKYVLRIKLDPRFDWCHHVQQRYLGFLWLRVSVNYDSVEKCQKFIDDYPELMYREACRKADRKIIQKPQTVKVEEVQ